MITIQIPEDIDRVHADFTVSYVKHLLDSVVNKNEMNRLHQEFFDKLNSEEVEKINELNDEAKLDKKAPENELALQEVVRNLQKELETEKRRKVSAVESNCNKVKELEEAKKRADSNAGGLQRYLNQIEELTKERDEWKRKFFQMEENYKTLNGWYTQTQKENKGLKEQRDEWKKRCESYSEKRSSFMVSMLEEIGRRKLKGQSELDVICSPVMFDFFRDETVNDMRFISGITPTFIRENNFNLLDQMTNFKYNGINFIRKKDATLPIEFKPLKE